jgi:hypothetical protein
MPHGIYVRLRPCYVAPRLGYDMPHGTYARPCHVAFQQGIRHVTYVRPRRCHVTHMLGLRAWKKYNEATKLSEKKATYPFCKE